MEIFQFLSSWDPKTSLCRDLRIKIHQSKFNYFLKTKNKLEIKLKLQIYLALLSCVDTLVIVGLNHQRITGYCSSLLVKGVYVCVWVVLWVGRSQGSCLGTFVINSS